MQPPVETPTPEEQAFMAYQLAHKDETRQPNFYATVSICMFLAYCSVILRLLARRRKSQALLADDWWIIAALLPATVWDAFNYWAIREGLGLHVIRVTNVKALIQSSVGCMILYPLCLPPVKFSILYLYTRIFPGQSIRYIGIAIGLIVTGAALGASVSFGLQCIPLSSLWNGGDKKCINLGALSMATGVINIVTDVAILCLPIKPLIHLQASTRVRLGLLATFLVGGCVCVFSIIRTKVVEQSSQVDPSWNNAIGGIWSVIEVHVAIVCANLPVLRPLFRKSSPTGTAASSARPMIKSSGYIRSGESDDSKFTKRTHKNPFSITNNSLWKDEDDDVPLHDIEGRVLKNGQISQGTHIKVDIRPQSDEKRREPSNPF